MHQRTVNFYNVSGTCLNADVYQQFGKYNEYFSYIEEKISIYKWAICVIMSS